MYVELPVPPSVNKSWTFVMRRIRRGERAKVVKVRSAFYNQWLAPSVKVVKLRMEPKRLFPVKVVIQILGGDDWRDGERDIDNVVKGVFDCLKKAQIVPDDNTRYITETAVKHMRVDRKLSTVLVAVEASDEAYLISPRLACP
jgi:Holliday junction resolvase RusA-like endonuclease